MELIGAVFGLVITGGLGVAHLAAGRDPYRNFVTQLVFDWYDAHSPYEGNGLRRLLIISSVVYFFISALCGVAVIVQLAR
jgi:hypothetical protein